MDKKEVAAIHKRWCNLFKTDKDGDKLEKLFEELKYNEIITSTDGRFYDNITGCLLKENEVRCALKRKFPSGWLKKAIQFIQKDYIALMNDDECRNGIIKELGIAQPIIREFTEEERSKLKNREITLADYGY